MLTPSVATNSTLEFYRLYCLCSQARLQKLTLNHNLILSSRRLGNIYAFHLSCAPRGALVHFSRCAPPARLHRHQPRDYPVYCCGGSLLRSSKVHRVNVHTTR
jgi:hypothetical protein